MEVVQHKLLNLSIMKKITLLVASFLVGSMALTAQNPVFSNNNDRVLNNTRFSIDEPIVFMERGIEFYVFTNGDFDFNTRPDDSQGTYFFRKGNVRGASTVNRGPINYGVLIQHDSFGRVRRVGNTFINYDVFDRVSRIGSIYMRYNRDSLVQIGGLQIIYDRRGNIVDMIGSVTRTRGQQGFVTYYGPRENYYTNQSATYTYGNSNVYAYNQNEYYYYKADGTRALVEDKK